MSIHADTSSPQQPGLHGQTDSSAEETLYAFLNAAPVGLVQTDLRGQVSLINGVSAQLLMPLVAHRNLDNLFDALQQHLPGLRQKVREHRPLSGTVVDRQRLLATPARPDQDTTVIEFSLIRTGPDRLIALLSDISRQVRDEEALRHSQAKLAVTLDAAQVGDWELDLRTGALQHSLRHDRCFGHDTLQADWSLKRFFAQVHAEDRAETMQSLQAAAAGGAPWQAEFRVVWPDGGIHWLTAHATLQREAGRPRRLLGVVIDSTPLHEAQAVRLKAQQLQEENRQFEQASRMKSLFVANMSHELRTPLNAIIGFSDLMQRGIVTPDSPQFMRYVGHIASSGRHLLQLINDVLDLSKVEAGKIEFAPQQLWLDDIAHDTADVLAPQLQRKRLQLALEIDPALGPLWLDPSRLKQVLYNLLSNAIKFSPESESVTLRGLAEGPDHVRLEVEDHGPGIPAEDLPRLFVEFEQLDQGLNRPHEGTGLGLALCRRLVQAQGGRIGVRSTPGVRTVFEVVLNRAHGHDQAGQTGQADAGPDQDDRLLLAEHHDPLRNALVRGLSEAGFQVDTALNAEQAVQRARQGSYRGITLDLQLPPGRGLGALAQVRAEGSSRDAPVVALSMPADARQAAAFAVTNVLSKPIRRSEVALALAQLPTGDAPPRVLVVDDDPLALELMRHTLLDLQAEPLCFADGAAALAEVQARPPAAMVLDLMMPGMDGFQVLDALRRLPAGAELPVFIWTTLSLAEDDYASLSRSAAAIVGQGGGSVAALLGDLARWRDEMLRRPPLP